MRVLHAVEQHQHSARRRLKSFQKLVIREHQLRYGNRADDALMRGATAHIGARHALGELCSGYASLLYLAAQFGVHHFDIKVHLGQRARRVQQSVTHRVPPISKYLVLFHIDYAVLPATHPVVQHSCREYPPEGRLMCRRSPVINRFGTFFERRVLVSISPSGTPPSAMTARSKPIKPSIVSGSALSRCTNTLRSSLVTECTFLAISILSWSNISTPLCVPSGTTSFIIFLSVLFLFLSNTEMTVFGSDPRSVCGYASIAAVTAPLCRRSATSEAQFSINGPERPKWVNNTLPVLEKAFLPSTKNVIFIKESGVPDNPLDHFSATLSGTIVGVGAATVWPSSRSHSNPSPVEPVSGCDTLPVASMYEVARCSAVPQYTALMPDLSVTIFVTAEPVRTTTPPPRTYF